MLAKQKTRRLRRSHNKYKRSSNNKYGGDISSSEKQTQAKQTQAKQTQAKQTQAKQTQAKQTQAKQTQAPVKASAAKTSFFKKITGTISRTLKKRKETKLAKQTEINQKAKIEERKTAAMKEFLRYGMAPPEYKKECKNYYATNPPECKQCKPNDADRFFKLYTTYYVAPYLVEKKYETEDLIAFKDVLEDLCSLDLIEDAGIYKHRRERAAQAKKSTAL
jgi:hypothetical protein